MFERFKNFLSNRRKLRAEREQLPKDLENHNGFFGDRRKAHTDRRQPSTTIDRRDEHHPQFKHAEEWYLSVSVDAEEISTEQVITELDTAHMSPDKTTNAKQKTMTWAAEHAPKDTDKS